MHWSTGNYQPLQERALWAGIADAYDAGVIRAVGLSNFGPKQLRRIHAYMSDRGVPIATLQVQYSLLSRFPETNGTRETCDELGVRLIAYSPLALGLLTGKYSTDAPPPGLRGFAYKDVLPALPELLGTMREIGDGRGGKTPAQVAVNWCLCKDATPIPGVKNARQLEENLGALGVAADEGRGGRARRRRGQVRKIRVAEHLPDGVKGDARRDGAVRLLSRSYRERETRDNRRREKPPSLGYILPHSTPRRRTRALKGCAGWSIGSIAFGSSPIHDPSARVSGSKPMLRRYSLRGPDGKGA